MFRCHNYIIVFLLYMYVVPPRIAQPPVNTTVSEGDLALLTCQATGDPLPTVIFLIIAHQCYLHFQEFIIG